MSIIELHQEWTHNPGLAILGTSQLFVQSNGERIDLYCQVKTEALHLQCEEPGDQGWILEKKNGLTRQKLRRGQDELWKGLEFAVTGCCSEERELVGRINPCKCQKFFKDHSTEECVREKERAQRSFRAVT